MDSYKILAGDYDFLNPKEEVFKQLGFFERIIAKYGIKTCLDCACGTGWHLAMLEDLGVECNGSDISRYMLIRAKQNLKGRNIRLRQADFRKLHSKWNRKFDLVLCLTTSLPHMLTEQETLAALRSMNAVLNPGGILVISNGITDKLLDTRPRFLPGRIHKDRAFYFFLEYPDPGRVIFNILFVQTHRRSLRHQYHVIEYSALRQSTLKKYFARVNFRSVQYLGSFRFSPYSPRTSRRLIAIAEK